MQVFREERLDLGFVCFTHGLRRDFDLVAILVASLDSEIVDFLNGIQMKVQDSKLLQGFDIDGAPRVVGEALVALCSKVVS